MISVLTLLGAVVVYVAVLWLLRAPAALDPSGMRKILALAMCASAVVLLSLLRLAIFLPFGAREPVRGILLAETSLICACALVMGGYAAIAIRVYYQERHEAEDRRTLLNGFLGATGLLLFLLAMAAVVPIRTRHPWAVNEAITVGNLRAINAAEVGYARVYNSSYSPTLDALGPKPKGSQPTAAAADLIDGILSSGKKSGYTFTYLPGALAQSGRVSAYKISARPIEFGKTGIRSFFADESGSIRFTPEDRAATSKDPPIE